jgi:hypothetical protein
VKLWFAWTKRENNKNCQVIGLQDVSQWYSNPTPTKEQYRSIPKWRIKVQHCKELIEMIEIDINCHIWSLESEDVSRRAGFDKTGITSSSWLCLTQIIVFLEMARRRAHTNQRWAWSTTVGGRPASSYGRSGWPCCQTGPLLVCCRRFLHRPVKPHLGRRSRLVGSYGCKAHPQHCISSPQTP